MSTGSELSRNDAHVSMTPLGATPVGVALHPLLPRIFVSHPAERMVSVVDLPAGKVVATVEVDATPGGLAVSAGGETLYIAGTEKDVAGSGRLTIADAADARVVASHPVGRSAVDVVCRPGGKVLVVDGDDHALVTVDPLDGNVAAALRVEGYPGRPVPASGELMVPVRADLRGALLAVDESGSAVRARLDLDFRPGRCAVTPDARTLYVCDPANALLHRVALPALQRIGAPIVVDPDGVSDVAIDPAGEVLRVVGEDRLWTLGTTEHLVVGHPVALPGGATELRLGPDGRRAVVALVHADGIAVVEFWAAG